MCASLFEESKEYLRGSRAVVRRQAKYCLSIQSSSTRGLSFVHLSIVQSPVWSTVWSPVIRRQFGCAAGCYEGGKKRVGEKEEKTWIEGELIGDLKNNFSFNSTSSQFNNLNRETHGVSSPTTAAVYFRPPACAVLSASV
ncbi:hypothetical protein IC582_026948 [Cucumis melo]